MSDLLPTTVVGSYPQPDWLIDRTRLGRPPAAPRPRARALARRRGLLEQAQDDATLLAIRDMERAGVDIVSDGEMRRESYSNRFATALEGHRHRQPGHRVPTEPGARAPGAARRRPDPAARPSRSATSSFCRAHTDRPIKITAAGPVHDGAAGPERPLRRTMRALALAYADAVNEEARDLKAAGADVVQIDEP